MDLMDKLFEKLGLTEMYHSVFYNFFEYTLSKDIRKRNNYKGYPDGTTKFLDKISRRTGIPLVNHPKQDYTLAPLIDYIMGNMNLTKTKIHDFLLKLNMMMFGGFTKYGRLKIQKKLLDAYLEYENKYETVTILENLLNQNHPFYVKKILFKHRTDTVDRALGFKSFILNNDNYFKEVRVFFTVDERTEVDSIRDACSELDSMMKSSFRKQLMNSNFIYTGVDLVGFLITFNKVLIPQILENFEVGISSFSPIIQKTNNFAVFLITKWFIYIPVIVFIVMFLKSKVIKILVDYAKIKIPYIKDYIMDDELLKFLKTYLNMMDLVSPREAFVYAYERLDNNYIKHVLNKNINGGKFDLMSTAKPLCEVLQDIPYIPKEYTDILTQSYVVGKPQDGLEKVIHLVEPRIEKTSKILNRNIFIGTFVVSTVLTLALSGLMYKDAMQIIDISDQKFIDELRR